MELLNTLQWEIIEHLNRFGFLTGSQFQMLTGKSAGYIREMLGKLRRLGYVRSFRNAISHAIHTENMYVNTPLAVELLASHKNIVHEDIKMITTAYVVNDFHHRYNSATVSLKLWQHFRQLNIPIRLMLSYFDKVGNPKKGTLTAKTAIQITGRKTIIPDIVFKTDNALILGEVYCDKDSQRIVSQLSSYAYAISSGTPAATFDIPNTNPSVAAVFLHIGIKQAVIKGLSANEGFAKFAHLYFFASLEDVKNNIATAWKDINGNTLVLK